MGQTALIAVPVGAGDRLYISLGFVHPSWRRRGLARSLLVQIIQIEQSVVERKKIMFKRPCKIILSITLLILVSACGPAIAPVPAPTNTPVAPDATYSPPANVPQPSPTPTPQPSLSLAQAVEGLIAFYSDRDGNPEIYTMNADGSGQRRLTNDPAFDDSPAISPDGQQIAFLAARHDANPQFPNLKYEIYVMDSDGGNPRRLTHTEAAEGHPAWSPDGSKILFDADYDGDGFAEIYTMNPNGIEVTRLTFNAANDQFADWSPDGSQIAFSSDRDGNWDIFMMNADGTDQRLLTTSPDWEVFPAWSPDGRQIAFNGLVPRSRNTDVFLVNADGSEVRQLTDSPGFDENPAWSPDGRQIAFQTQRDGKFEIYVMNSDGSEQYPLAAYPADELWPSWAPAATPKSGSSLIPPVIREIGELLRLDGPVDEATLTPPEGAAPPVHRPCKFLGNRVDFLPSGL